MAWYIPLIINPKNKHIYMAYQIITRQIIRHVYIYNTSYIYFLKNKLLYYQIYMCTACNIDPSLEHTAHIYISSNKRWENNILTILKTTYCRLSANLPPYNDFRQLVDAIRNNTNMQMTTSTHNITHNKNIYITKNTHIT